MLSTLIVLALQSAPAPVASAATARDAEDDSKMICRRSAETGSFVRKTKVCRTRADWRRMEEAAREEGGRMQSQISTERGG